MGGGHGNLLNLFRSFDQIKHGSIEIVQIQVANLLECPCYHLRNIRRQDEIDCEIISSDGGFIGVVLIIRGEHVPSTW